MVKYDGTVRNSHEHIVQFLYGEDAMAGEHIEDMNFAIMTKSDKDIRDMTLLVPNREVTPEVEANLSKFMESHNIQVLKDDLPTLMELEEEYRQVIKDRDFLRTCGFLDTKQKTHLPVNVGRLITNAKADRKILPSSKSDLNPREVIDTMKSLIDGLKVFPGCDLQNDPLAYEANENGTTLFKIFIRQVLSTKQVIAVHRLSKDAFRDIVEEIKQRFLDALARAGENIGSMAA
jgi:DNA-directed RNA polymerase II subunit RPB1